MLNEKSNTVRHFFQSPAQTVRIKLQPHKKCSGDYRENVIKSPTLPKNMVKSNPSNCMISPFPNYVFWGIINYSDGYRFVNCHN